MSSAGFEKVRTAKSNTFTHRTSAQTYWRYKDSQVIAPLEIGSSSLSRVFPGFEKANGGCALMSWFAKLVSGPTSTTSGVADRGQGRGRIYDNITETVGNTPCVKISDAICPQGRTIYAKFGLNYCFLIWLWVKT